MEAASSKFSRNPGRLEAAKLVMVAPILVPA